MNGLPNLLHDGPDEPGGRKSPSSRSPSMTALRGRLAELDAAMFTEGIDPAGPLGVWCRAQKNAIAVLAEIAEEQSTRIVERAEAVEEGMRAGIARVDAEVVRLKAETEAARQLTLTVRSQTANLKEERLKAGDDMAVRLSDKIQDCLKTTMLVRERRWNLRQNVRLVSLGCGVLFAAFLSGQWMQGHSLGVDIIERCRTHLAVNPDTKVAYCAMTTVEGVPEPARSPAPAR